MATKVEWLFPFFFGGGSSSGGGGSTTINILDEGSSLGSADSLNIVGSTLSASLSGSTATINSQPDNVFSVTMSAFPITLRPTNSYNKIIIRTDKDVNINCDDGSSYTESKEFLILLMAEGHAEIKLSSNGNFENGYDSVILTNKFEYVKILYDHIEDIWLILERG